jgi:hypothetical protein
VVLIACPPAHPPAGPANDRVQPAVAFICSWACASQWDPLPGLADAPQLPNPAPLAALPAGGAEAGAAHAFAARLLAKLAQHLLSQQPSQAPSAPEAPRGASGGGAPDGGAPVAAAGLAGVTAASAAAGDGAAAARQLLQPFLMEWVGSGDADAGCGGLLGAAPHWQARRAAGLVVALCAEGLYCPAAYLECVTGNGALRPSVQAAPEAWAHASRHRRLIRQLHPQLPCMGRLGGDSAAGVPAWRAGLTWGDEGWRGVVDGLMAHQGSAAAASLHQQQQREQQAGGGAKAAAMGPSWPAARVRYARARRALLQLTAGTRTQRSSPGPGAPARGAKRTSPGPAGSPAKRARPDAAPSPAAAAAEQRADPAPGAVDGAPGEPRCRLAAVRAAAWAFVGLGPAEGDSRKLPRHSGKLPEDGSSASTLGRSAGWPSAGGGAALLAAAAQLRPWEQAVLAAELAAEMRGRARALLPAAVAEVPVGAAAAPLQAGARHGAAPEAVRGTGGAEQARHAGSDMASPASDMGELWLLRGVSVLLACQAGGCSALRCTAHCRARVAAAYPLSLGLHLAAPAYQQCCRCCCPPPAVASTRCSVLTPRPFVLKQAAPPPKHTPYPLRPCRWRSRRTPGGAAGGGCSCPGDPGTQRGRAGLHAGTPHAL